MWWWDAVHDSFCVPLVCLCQVWCWEVVVAESWHTGSYMAALKRICTVTTSGTSVQKVSERRQVTQEGVVLSFRLAFSSKGSRNRNNDEALMRSEWLWLLMRANLFESPSPSRLRRFHNSLTDNQRWIRERSHESYAKNYSVVFPFDEPLASRNMRKDPFHQVDGQFDLNAAFFERVQGNNPNARLSGVS